MMWDSGNTSTSVVLFPSDVGPSDEPVRNNFHVCWSAMISQGKIANRAGRTRFAFL
jgi:hypothetical protein